MSNPTEQWIEQAVGLFREQFNLAIAAVLDQGQTRYAAGSDDDSWQVRAMLHPNANPCLVTFAALTKERQAALDRFGKALEREGHDILLHQSVLVVTPKIT